MISYPNSSWGLKRSKQNITNDILNIITNANEFIIVGGYNFTFKTAGYTFFSELRRKASYEIPVLIILPPTLYGAGSNLQTKIIDFCKLNGIGIILNGNNHSKWILTENNIYYGSSNFSETSWTRKVEVVTIHNHNNIRKQWKTDMINDFKLFVQDEISLITKRTSMTRIPDLIIHTQDVWMTIKAKILRLNPSLEKVKFTLNNYEDVILDLQEICALWFETNNYVNFEKVQKQSKIILKKVNELCSFAYNNMFNEVINNDESFVVNLKQEIIDVYNQHHSELFKIIDDCTENLNHIPVSTNSNEENKNLHLINKVHKALENINYS